MTGRAIVYHGAMNPNPSDILAALYEADEAKFFDDPAGVAMFDPPIVGVADAADPLFERIARHVGEFYWTPQQALDAEAPGATARSVICWCLPIAAPAREANRAETDRPSRLWAYVRTFGQAFNNRLGDGLLAKLREAGSAASAPGSAKGFSAGERPGIGWASTWSERHTGFVAGLGTFGIHGGLITVRGVAHRLGSVVTDLALPATARPYGDDLFAWCLRMAKGTCGACIARCPVGSVGETPGRRDKAACREHTYGVGAERGEALFGFRGAYGCGLCQTGVPCESRNPVGP